VTTEWASQPSKGEVFGSGGAETRTIAMF